MAVEIFGVQPRSLAERAGMHTAGWPERTIWELALG